MYLYQSLTRPSPNLHTLPEKLPPPPPPPPATQPPVPIIKVSTNDTLGKRSAVEEESVVSEGQQVGRKLSIKGQHDRDRKRRKRKDSSPFRSAGSGTSTPASAEDGAQPSTTMKRLKPGIEEEKPSLLLRMGHPRRVSPAAGGRNTSQSESRSTPEVSSQRRRRRRSSSHSSPAPGLPDVSLGISIKGAARSHSHSLLERIQGNGT